MAKLTQVPTVERPILFNGAMVRALIEGRKTQTRRVVKPQPEFFEPNAVWQSGAGHGGIGWYVHTDEYPDEGSQFYRCPYGQPGDRLWVRETWAAEPDFDSVRPSWLDETEPISYAADYTELQLCQSYDNLGVTRWRPSIHMPRCFSRILLEVTDVRVEQVQAVTFADCKAEGMDEGYSEGVAPCPGEECDGRHHGEKWHFQSLWGSINGPRGFGWDSNPWVWVVEFKRVVVIHTAGLPMSESIAARPVQ